MRERGWESRRGNGTTELGEQCLMQSDLGEWGCPVQNAADSLALALRVSATVLDGWRLAHNRSLDSLGTADCYGVLHDLGREPKRSSSLLCTEVLVLNEWLAAPSLMSLVLVSSSQPSSSRLSPAPTTPYKLHYYQA